MLYWAAEFFAAVPGMSDANTLKVFIAPEFYFRRASEREVDKRSFRRSTSFGSYPECVRYQLAEALYGVIQASPLFSDWLIVAGTVCSVLPPTDAENDGGRMNLLNTAIMLRGQRASADASVPYVLMEKHYISNIDGPPDDYHANEDPTTVFSFRRNPDFELDNLIHWDGMTVGLEVCLDHSEQVLVNAVDTLQDAIGPDAQLPDLQLITSCGMNVEEEAVAVRDGGLVLLTDGMSRFSRDLPEPRFRVGRFNAAAGTVQFLDPQTQFQFCQLQGDDNYEVNYCGGLYAQKGRRQGVWCAKQPLPMHPPLATRGQQVKSGNLAAQLIPAAQVTGGR